MSEHGLWTPGSVIVAVQGAASLVNCPEVDLLGAVCARILQYACCNPTAIFDGVLQLDVRAVPRARGRAIGHDRAVNHDLQTIVRQLRLRRSMNLYDRLLRRYFNNITGRTPVYGELNQRAVSHERAPPPQSPHPVL